VGGGGSATQTVSASAAQGAVSTKPAAQVLHAAHAGARPAEHGAMVYWLGARGGKVIPGCVEAEVLEVGAVRDVYTVAEDEYKGALDKDVVMCEDKIG